MAGVLKVDSINADSNLALKIANTAVAFIDATGLRPVAGNLNLDATGTSKFYLPSANTVAIQTAGVTAVTVDSSQNVGIGTASPSYKLDVSGQVRANSGASASALIANSTSAGGTALNVQNSGTVNMLIGGYSSIVGSGSASDVMLSATQGVLAFGTGASSTERMRITSIGAMSMINAVGGTGNIRATNSSNTSGDVNVIALLGANAINTSSYAWISGQNGAGDKCYIYGNGNIQNLNNSYGGISDVKLKENIVDSGSQWNDIKAIRVRKYSMKADALTAPNMLGVIAQELEASGMNKLVFESPDRQNEGEVIKQVNYSILYMKAVKALQEAMERIETLETKSDTQAETINALTARIVALESK